MFVVIALQSAISPIAPVDPEIVVLAKKLQSIDVDMKLEKRAGRMVLRSCHLTRPSGDVELDAVPWGVAQQCISEGVEGRKQLVACVEDKSNRRIDAIVAVRRGTPVGR